MVRAFVVICIFSFFATTSCLQDHEPTFFPEEVENILSGLDTAAWQMDVLIENGNRIPLNQCEQATLLVFYNSNDAFERIDVAPFCNGSGGVIESGTWEVTVDEETNERSLILTIEPAPSITYQIENITPFAFRLIRNIQNGESTLQEIREYKRVELESDNEES